MNNNKRLVILSLMLAVTPSVNATEPYTITDLGDMGGNSYAYAINDQGAIAGNAFAADGLKHLFIYEDGVMTDLGLVENVHTYPNAINNQGFIVGYAQLNTSNYAYPFLYDGQTLARIMEIPQHSGVNDINNSNVMVGNVWGDGFSLVDGVFTRYSAEDMSLNGLNDHNVYVGSVFTAQTNGLNWAVSYENGVINYIGSLPGYDRRTFAIDITNTGKILGYLSISSGSVRKVPFIFENESTHYIGNLSASNLDANAINEDGVVVGQDLDSYSAFIYSKADGFIDPSTLVDLSANGWQTLVAAHDINNRGEIVGWGKKTSGELAAFLLSPASIEGYPEISITSPSDGTSIADGEYLVLQALASDTQDGDLSGSIVWQSSIDGVLGSGNNLQSLLSVGIHTLTATVEDSDGNITLADVSVNVINALPEIVILSPDSQAANTGDTLMFAASAQDLEDGDLSAYLTWNSSVSGLIGQGSGFSTILPEGNHSITASVVDSAGQLGSLSMDLVVTNQPPIAADDVVSVDEGSNVVFSILSNDSDQFEGIDVLSTIISAQPSHGSVSIMPSGDINYTHDGSESTTDSFSYTVADNAGAVSNIATVNITVNPVNDPPTANDDQLTLGIGESASISILANDNDPEGALNSGSVQFESLPNHGNLSLNSDGSVQYSHIPGAGLADSFTYSVYDNSGLISNIAAVSITIENAQDLEKFEFESGLPQSSEGWTYYSSNASYGRIAAVNGKMRMDVTVNGYYSLNEAIYTLDLSGAKNAVLSFYQADFGDEANPMPSTFNGHYNADGVAISMDGSTWYSVLPSSQLEVSTSGLNYNVDLDALVNTIQSSFNPGFKLGANTQIKFQQYDNYSYPTDGREWDNIQVTAEFSNLLVSPNEPLEFSISESEIGLSQCETYTLSNTSSAALSWTANTQETWLSLSSTGGELALGAEAIIDVCWDSSGFQVGETRTASITFSDLSSAETQIQTLSLSVVGELDGLPFEETFSNGMPDTSDGTWQFYSSNSSRGRIGVANGRLRMDVNANGSFSLNEMILSLDLAQASNIQLAFSQYETADEVHTMPESFTGHHNSDGVAISADGWVWYQVVGASELDVGTGGQAFTVDLDAEIARIKSSYDSGFGYTNEFFVKFQQYDNYMSPTDGREWDDISIRVVP